MTGERDSSPLGDLFHELFVHQGFGGKRPPGCMGCLAVLGIAIAVAIPNLLEQRKQDDVAPTSSAGPVTSETPGGH